ncbi:hypothetical protein DAPPUDRAFT_321704 [Daphnia pulex]|uniref:SEC63 domain-containing protein n=1 Tax=Daphnia pulex TaxID=6669 RepID=E9GTM7_DAPPU|nr:hypothetical protein DAPPUDRAFT_321704 [Daphnia pulex]|eukprot:EFX77185.1 hypothetical protein DAPPUDRAFT_321704 [Daphnia pulex]
MKKEVEDKKKTAAASSKTAIKAKEEESESCSEVEAEDEVELDESDDGEAEAANSDGSLPEKDDDQLEKLQSDVALRRQRLLGGKRQFSQSVYCPFCPEDKQEYWWAYITDRKQQMLLTAPYHITNLVEHEEIQLKFTAPFKPGFYTFAVCLRSDSYFGFDQMKDIKMDVKEAEEIPTEHPQWDISSDISDDEDEEDKNSGGSESEFATDDDDEESGKD